VSPSLPDFSRSFLTFTVNGRSNTARIQLDAVCSIADGARAPSRFALITPCKAERMYLDRGLFQDPNYDFCGIWSDEEFLILRTFATHDPTRAAEWDVGQIADRFEEVTIDVRLASAAEPLADDEQVVAAMLAGRPIVAETHLRDAATGQTAVIEYPVKTMNVVDARHGGPRRFQVDTGPLLVPAWVGPADVPIRGGRAIEGLDLAFVCYNTLTDGATELVLREPTPSERAGPHAWHYARIVSVPARHTLFAVE